MCKGRIFNIQRFCTDDGPGIRTTVFLKGCPLSCIWCHNPESQHSKSEILLNTDKCICCGACLNVCTNHSINMGKHILNSGECTHCGKCLSACPHSALEICGEITDIDSIAEIVLKDRDFYESSGGGVTLSGGEPLFQSDFALNLLEKLKSLNIHTAVETCGYFSGDITAFVPYVDLWLFDIKLFDDDEHRKFTGVSNKIILANLRALDTYGAKIILRCPIIPDVNFNEKHFSDISGLAVTLENVSEIHLLPYHPLGISKSAYLGRESLYQNNSFLNAEDIKPLLPAFSTSLKVKIL